MNTTEHLLTCLIEECAEVQKHATKALRFGPDDIDPTLDALTASTALTERELINVELADLYGVVELLIEAGVLPYNKCREAIERKKVKVRQFMDYAREHGALQ